MIITHRANVTHPILNSYKFSLDCYRFPTTLKRFKFLDGRFISRYKARKNVFQVMTWFSLYSRCRWTWSAFFIVCVASSSFQSSSCAKIPTFSTNSWGNACYAGYVNCSLSDVGIPFGGCTLLNWMSMHDLGRLNCSLIQYQMFTGCCSRSLPSNQGAG